MPTDKPEPVNYPYLSLGGRDSSYLFETAHGFRYEVKFKPSFYAFGEDFAYADQIYELVIKVLYALDNANPPFDARTAPTIAAIVNDFYDRSDLTITIYICDTSDRREKARWYKFNRWYDHFNANNYFRVDQSVLDEKDGVMYHCAFIIKADNPNKMAVITAFNRLMDGYNVAK